MYSLQKIDYRIINISHSSIINHIYHSNPLCGYILGVRTQLLRTDTGKVIKYLEMVLELGLLCSLTLPCCNSCLTEPLKLCKCGFDQIPTHTLALPRLQLSELTSESLNSGAVLKSNICTYPSKT